MVGKKEAELLGAQHTEHEILPGVIILSRATREGEITGLSCPQRKANTSFRVHNT